MSEFVGIVTNIGQQKIAAAIGGAALNLTTIRVGDGNGAAITPAPAMIDLVHRVGAAYPIISSGRDATNLTHWRVTALIPAADGPFDIREIGVFDAAGDMIAIAKHVLVEKRSPDQGAAVELTTDIVFPVSETAQVTVQIQPSAAVSVLQLLRAGFCTVESAAIANPPANPALGATYVVAASPTGAWAGLTNRLVQWNGTVWVSVDVPQGFLVVAQDKAVNDPSRWLRRVAGAWVNASADEATYGVTLLATKAETQARVVNSKAVHPRALTSVLGAGNDFRTVINASTAASPANPATGDAYLIAAAATGAWAGHSGKIATWDGEEWIIEQLRLGGRVVDRSQPLSSLNRELRQFAALAWTPVQASEAETGHVQLATKAETQARAINSKAVHPRALTGIVGAGNDFRTVINAVTANPPANPVSGDAYLVAAAATGVWAGHTGKIATWDGEEWIIEQLRLGARVINRSVAITQPSRELRQTAALIWDAVQASEANFGHVRLATAAEVTAGVDATLAVSPANLINYVAPAIRHRRMSAILPANKTMASTWNFVSELVLDGASTLTASAFASGGLTIGAADAGLYLLDWRTVTDASVNSGEISIYLNGNPIAFATGYASGFGINHTLAFTVALAAGDLVRPAIYDSPGGQSLLSGVTRFSAVRLSAA